MNKFTSTKLLVVTQTAVKIVRMAYHPRVLEHYQNARNFGVWDKLDKTVGNSIVGAPNSNNVVKLRMEIDENGKIINARFKTFGSASPIVTSSLVTKLVKGKTVEEGLQITNKDVAKQFCTSPEVSSAKLAENAIKNALIDYKKKQNSECM